MTMIEVGSVIDNPTICDLFGVASMGGIRVCNARNHIVVISNNTDPLYRNEWRGDVLHFVGMGTTGPQKLDRQNRTLANSTKAGAALHLFEVFEKSRYVYFGEVELVGEPYVSDQDDARAESRFVWIFPLRRKLTRSVESMQNFAGTSAAIDHLPHGAYAVIGLDMSDDQIDLLNGVLDRLKESGLIVFDKRDVDKRRYDKAMDKWYRDVLDNVRSSIKELIAKKKHRSKVERSYVGVRDDELEISSGSNEYDLRAALKLLDRDDRVSAEAVFEEARQRVPMPDVPKSLRSWITADEAAEFARPRAKPASIDRAKFDGLT
jgi:hypothetical protein